MAFGDIVQTKTANNDGSDPISVTFDSPPTAGNLIVITTFNFDGAATAGGTLIEAIEKVHTSNGDAGGIYYRVVEGGDGSTWTVDLAAADQWVAVAREYEGPFEATPLDQTGSSENAPISALAVTAGGATSQNDELVIAAWGLRVGEAASNVVTGVDNSFTDVANSQNSVGFAWQLSAGTAKKVLSATGTPTVTGTFSAEVDFAVAVLATFKKSAGGGGGGGEASIAWYRA